MEVSPSQFQEVPLDRQDYEEKPGTLYGVSFHYNVHFALFFGQDLSNKKLTTVVSSHYSSLLKIGDNTVHRIFHQFTGLLRALGETLFTNVSSESIL